MTVFPGNVAELVIHVQQNWTSTLTSHDTKVNSTWVININIELKLLKKNTGLKKALLLWSRHKFLAQEKHKPLKQRRINQTLLKWKISALQNTCTQTKRKYLQQICLMDGVLYPKYTKNFYNLIRFFKWAKDLKTLQHRNDEKAHEKKWLTLLVIRENKFKPWWGVTMYLIEWFKKYWRHWILTKIGIFGVHTHQW